MKTAVVRSIERDAGAQERSASEASADPAVRVFEHWVWMLGKARAVLGPTRRALIERQLRLYDEETLLLAIDGMAGSRWHAGENDRGTAFQSIELALRNEEKVERFAELGQALADQAERELQRREKVAREARDVRPISGEDLAAHRQRVAEVRREIAARARGVRL